MSLLYLLRELVFIWKCNVLPHIFEEVNMMTIWIKLGFWETAHLPPPPPPGQHFALSEQ